MPGRSSARSYGYHPDAAIELLEALDYLRADRREAADALQAEVEKAIQRLLQFPEIGSVIRQSGGIRYRRWKLERFRYSLVYAFVADEIRIYAVAHHSRDSRYWLDRLSTR